MKNIELFNLFAADIFSRLYLRFPLPTEISPDDLIKEHCLDEISETDARQIAGHTLLWLSDAGYMIKYGEIANFRYVLSTKGLEILNAAPIKGSGSNSLSLGDQLICFAKTAVADGAKSEAKKIVQQILRWGIGLGLAGLTNM